MFQHLLRAADDMLRGVGYFFGCILNIAGFDGLFTGSFGDGNNAFRDHMRGLGRLVGAGGELVTGLRYMLGHIVYMTDDAADIFNHMIEGVAQRAHFIISRDVYLARQIAASHFAGLFHQMGNRRTYAAVEDGNHGGTENNHDQKSHNDACVDGVGDRFLIICLRRNKYELHIVNAEGNTHNIAVFTENIGFHEFKIGETDNFLT